ncbi:TraB/GumN family protein [Joostella atrarenae]|uniref:TraB/GumN family protein n=1 Tax=Joostella atrarenae TaxID=679257 RepID=A0ABS9J264_9FLAO|nr:TraB/GumN family protein [Joostella atrarenae]MCF8714513.1 TraB/GumN family protein [Joostella atrarenae]
MKIKLLLILNLILLNSCFQNETSEFEVGNLWKITSKSGIESYVYGTVHLYPKNELELSKKIISKLENCKVLALERDITDSAEQEKFLNFELPQYFIESYRALTLEYGNELVSMEGQLIKIAKKNGIKISGLESTNEILAIMTEMGKIEFPQSEFEKDKIIEVYQHTLNLYKKEQILIFKDSMISQMPTKMVDLSINLRNQNWIEDIINLVENKSTFIAVGMGHLGGENGLLKLLKDKEYKLERIK